MVSIYIIMFSGFHHYAISLSFLLCIIIIVKPRFIHKPEDTTGFEKENITLQCKVTGYPPPRVIWLKNGDKIKPDEYIQVVNG